MKSVADSKIYIKTLFYNWFFGKLTFSQIFSRPELKEKTSWNPEYNQFVKICKPPAQRRTERIM